MIIGLGVDIVEIPRIGRIYGRFGQRFLEKIFTPEELDALPPASASALAGRFAAKEAAVKALGTGFSRGIGPRQIAIGHDSRGGPRITFLGRADERRGEIGVRRALLSISHERSMALAVVVLEA
ncbi:MAG: holo-ACP synthase [Desulfovibrio sp.]|jgi:holo-[acyl-carrier protein] synthase|nr:holo-ACP synthase [Desulfovibrio sp.]